MITFSHAAGKLTRSWALFNGAASTALLQGRYFRGATSGALEPLRIDFPIQLRPRVVMDEFHLILPDLHGHFVRQEDAMVLLEIRVGLDQGTSLPSCGSLMVSVRPTSRLLC